MLETLVCICCQQWQPFSGGTGAPLALFVNGSAINLEPNQWLSTSMHEPTHTNTHNNIHTLTTITICTLPVPLANGSHCVHNVQQPLTSMQTQMSWQRVCNVVHKTEHAACVCVSLFGFLVCLCLSQNMLHFQRLTKCAAELRNI